MAMTDIRHEVIQALAQTNELIRETQSILDHGDDTDRVAAAGEMDSLKRQRAMLQARLVEIDERVAAHKPDGSLTQELFNLKLQLEHGIARG